MKGMFFEPHIVAKSFDDVGLWPWNPRKNWKSVDNNCPAVSQSDRDRVFHPPC